MPILAALSRFGRHASVGSLPGAMIALVIGLGFALSIPGRPALAVEGHSASLPLRAEVPPPGGASHLCQTYAWAYAPGTSRLPLDDRQIALIDAVNRAANARIRPISDQEQYHVAEKWTLPSARGGDCEDYALYKKAELIRAGISPDRLLMAAVLDRSGKSHAVLVLHAEAGDYVLDNLKDSLRRWDETGYTFLRMQDPRDPSRWVATMAGGMLDRATATPDGAQTSP